MRSRLKGIACQIAAFELVIVLLVLAPVLIFDAWMPIWAVVTALISIPVLWLVRWVARGSITRRSPLDVPILILLLMVPVGVWAAADVSLSLPEVYRILLGIVLFYAAINTLVDVRWLRLATALLLVATALLGLVSVLGTHKVGSKLPLPLLDTIVNQLPTPIQPFWNPAGFNPNIAGGSLAMLLPLPIAFAVGGRQRWLRVTAALVALVGSLALLVTRSMGSIIGLLIGVLAMGMVYSRRFRLATALMGLVGLAAIAWLGFARAGGIVLGSGGDSGVGSLEGRLELWSRALFMIQDFPFTGIGLGMFDRVRDVLYPLFLLPPQSQVFHPHNVFLAQGVAAGVPGLVAFAALVLLLFVMAVQSVHLSRAGEFWPLSLGLLGALAAYLGHGLFDSISSFIKAHTILWGLFGLQTALWLSLRETEKQMLKADADDG